MAPVVGVASGMVGIGVAWLMDVDVYAEHHMDMLAC